MRIFESTIQLASYHAAEEADVVQEEKTRQIGRRGTRLRQSRGWGLDRDGLPSVWVDRVSISNQTRQKVQSEYSAGIETAARVTSETGETVFGNKELVERMVGETIDREVTVRTLRDGDDIRPGNGISSGFESTSVQRNSVERLVSVERTGPIPGIDADGFPSSRSVWTAAFPSSRTLGLNLIWTMTAGQKKFLLFPREVDFSALIGTTTEKSITGRNCLARARGTDSENSGNST